MFCQKTFPSSVSLINYPEKVVVEYRKTIYRRFFLGSNQSLMPQGFKLLMSRPVSSLISRIVEGIRASPFSTCPPGNPIPVHDFFRS